MNKLFTAVLLLTLAACGSSNAPPESSAPELSRLHGQWVVINYWAKWCKPCIKEIPELNELDRKYSQITVLGVNYDGATGKELATQLTDLGVEFAMLSADPASDLKLPRPVVLPTTIILDPEGNVSQTLIGPQTMASLARATQQLPAVPGEVR
jgi:thiol-disulfide isomerase/thioredoxin